MEELNSNNLDVLREEINKALAAVTSEHNVAFDIGKMTYDSESMSFKMTCTVIPEGVDPEYAEDYRSLERYGHFYGLTIDDFMKTFEIKHKGKPATVTITGVNPKKPKYCIRALLNGKPVSYGDSVLKHYKKPVSAK
jgi:hypothetical protein